MRCPMQAVHSATPVTERAAKSVATHSSGYCCGMKMASLSSSLTELCVQAGTMSASCKMARASYDGARAAHPIVGHCSRLPASDINACVVSTTSITSSILQMHRVPKRIASGSYCSHLRPAT